MKLKYNFMYLFFCTLFLTQSCQKDNDDVLYQSSDTNTQIKNFIWKGLNTYYLWQGDVPNLADKRFANQSDLNTFLANYSIPNSLFNDLRVAPTTDRFSWMVDDYITLEQQLQGTTKNSGIEFGLKYHTGSTTNIFGYVRYIVSGSDAATKDIRRGDIFTGVNGTALTINNYTNLLYGSADTFTLNMGDIVNNVVTPNGKSVTLTKTVLAENPIHINKVINSGAKKIGYLMYNGFYSNYNAKLNDAFGDLKSQGVTDLVLDLRYNGGGSVQTAIYLASMITGQFTGKIFSKQQWNAKINAYYDSTNSNALKNFFTDKIGTTSINSLNMTTVYVLTSANTASASELVINGLKPYINVVQIGDVTTGKNVGSVTLYDSPDFTTSNRNPNHRYAMQPIVLKIVNADNFGDYFNGLTPTHTLKETVGTLGVLGDENEPLLKVAIGKIIGTGKSVEQPSGKQFDSFDDSKERTEMYLEEIPKGLSRALN